MASKEQIRADRQMREAAAQKQKEIQDQADCQRVAEKLKAGIIKPLPLPPKEYKETTMAQEIDYQKLAEAVAKAISKQQYLDSPEGKQQQIQEALNQSVKDEYALSPTQQLQQEIFELNRGEYTPVELLDALYKGGLSGLEQIKRDLQDKRNIEAIKQRQADQLREQLQKLENEGA